VCGRCRKGDGGERRQILGWLLTATNGVVDLLGEWIGLPVLSLIVSSRAFGSILWWSCFLLKWASKTIVLRSTPFIELRFPPQVSQ
jgi:hypothetical protein